MLGLILKIDNKYIFNTISVIRNKQTTLSGVFERTGSRIFEAGMASLEAAAFTAFIFFRWNSFYQFEVIS